MCLRDGQPPPFSTWRKDLELRNPHPYPLLLRVEVTENRLTAGFWSLMDKPFQVRVLTDIVAVDPQAVVSRSAGQSGAIAQSGGRGYLWSPGAG